jgi:hypothetical protein
MDLTFGKENTFIGSEAGTNATTTSGSTAIGYRAMGGYAVTGTANTAVGIDSGRFLTTGEKNTLLGGLAAGGLLNGRANVSIGHYSMGAIRQEVSDSVVVGNNALAYHGAQCVAIGSSALHGSYNYSTTAASAAHTGSVAVGYQAGQSTTGSYNTFVGYQAGKGTGGSSGEFNVSLGAYAFDSFTTGEENTAVGRSSGHQITTGDKNTLLGSMAGDGITTGDANTIIGYAADVSANSVTKEIVIAASTNAMSGAGTETARIGTHTDYITNDFGENATWTHSSDRRIKIDIKDNTLGLDFINKLKTRNFKKKAPSEYPEEFDQHNPDTTERKNPDRIHYGFVAQEVKEAMDSVGHSEFPVWKENRDGMQELGEAELITPLVKAVQELTEKNERLENKIKDLEIFIIDKLGDE